MTANEEKFRRKSKKSEPPKAAVECMLQTEYQLHNHEHAEAMPQKPEGAGEPTITWLVSSTVPQGKSDPK